MKSCEIKGVIIKELAQNSDQRGWLIELFRRDEIAPEDYPVMSYLSMTIPGAIRGPHEHKYQTDLFCFTGPSTFRIHLWDNRKNSPTYGRKCTLEAGQDNRLMIIIPPGVVHAYQNIGDCEGLIFNAPNRLYAGEGKRDRVDEIRYEDDPNSEFRLTE